tara:strand:+ start:151 stop:408 length:258 start_codon:yes stop_codon:yes gene_type:complete
MSLRAFLQIDFSQRSARENTGAAAESAGSTSAPRANVQDALMAFMSAGPSNGGLKIGQSGTQHHFLGQVGGVDQFSAAVGGSGRY